MEEESFRRYLKKTGKSAKRCAYEVHNVKRFEAYLAKHKHKTLGEEKPEDLADFLAWARGKSEKGSARGTVLLFILARYYSCIFDDRMFCAVNELMGLGFIKKRMLKDLLGVNQQHTQALRQAGVSTAAHVLKAGRTDAGRRNLAEKTGVPLSALLELVKLADLGRIPGLAKKRARLYYDAGLDTLDKIAKWDSEEMRQMLGEFVARTRFDGSPPTPGEAAFSVKLARYLPRVVDY